MTNTISDDISSINNECFVAMWFGSKGDSEDEMNQLYEMVIKPAIEHHNFRPYHVGRDAAANKLDETILNAIDRANFVIVDLTHDPATGLRGSVLFEAGYAYRMKTVIWMCRNDLAESTPFDIRQFRQIRWSPNRLTEAKEKLVDVIENRIIERGKQRDNHEVRRLILETWKKIENQKDLVQPNSSVSIPADQISFVIFQELCSDLKTRVKYKEMGLSQDEKYELIDMIRGWEKITQMIVARNRSPGKDFYDKHVRPKLRASGWMS